MQARHLLWLCAALVALESPAGAQSFARFDEAATRRAAQAVERQWLEREIGRFASGRVPVLAGEVRVTQRDRAEADVVEGPALAALSPGPTQTLTIVFPDAQRWLRLAQEGGAPGVTAVSRLRTLHAGPGVSATCADCMAALADASDEMLLRLAADGELLDAARSRFSVEVEGHLRRIPPEALRLDHVLHLSPDIAAWRMRPDAPLVRRGREAVRDVAGVLRQDAPSPDGNTARFTCEYETDYTARHHVDLRDLTRFGVRDVTLGRTRVCCVDHELHDGSKMCTEEDAR